MIYSRRLIISTEEKNGVHVFKQWLEKLFSFLMFGLSLNDDFLNAVMFNGALKKHKCRLFPSEN